jgi:glutamyl-tRNA(Gln) amidotransferase subunit E
MATKNDIDIEDNNYFESLGFKCGLEIHQQLATEKKLFCRCPVGLTKRRHDAEILRHMRPTLSELGEYDGTALMEFKTKKNVIYRLYRDRTCTYEMDDTPPFLVNQQAIDYAIRISLLFNCRIVDEIHVVRKQYLDGSIPTGFQRTMIIGIDGWVPFRGRKIKINQVNLEEEACREVTDIGHEITFATDRLSIPLVEIITDCQMKNPDEAMEVCRLLGNAMKITGLVRRGIGTVRQDVNVSVEGGRRVEIKGVYKVGNIKPLTAIEAVRQKKLLDLRDIFGKRQSKPENIDYRKISLTADFSGSSNIIGRCLESDRPLKVMGMLLPQMRDIVQFPLQPDWNFGSELSGRVRVIACIDSKPNLFFLSHREKYDIPDTFWDRIKQGLNWRQGDDIVIVCGPSGDVATALNEIKIRIAELNEGVIYETRQDMKDGTTDFERILPGPDRMYPDTDHPPVKITPERVEENGILVGEPLWEKQSRWQQMGLHQEQIKALSLSPYADLFDRLSQSNKINIKKAAYICTDLMTALRREKIDLSGVDEDTLYEIINKSLIEDWPSSRLKKVLSRSAGREVSANTESGDFADSDFDDIWQQISAEFNGDRSNNEGKFRRFMTGRILAEYPGEVHQILNRIKEKLS